MRARLAPIAALAVTIAATAARADEPACPDARAAARLPVALTHTAAKLRGGGDLVIVALGSSSTAGYGASSPENAYPSRLAAELRARWPAVHVEVLNKGVGGETDIDMMRRADTDVLAHKPDLVIWQLGTNAVLEENGVARDAPRIEAGIERLKAAGADVILMSPQYAPKVLTDPDHGEMIRMLDAVAQEEHVALFRRFAIMRDWIGSGGAGFDSILSPDGLHMNDTSYRCIAHLLADAIVAATPGPAPPLMAATPGR